MDNLDGVVLVTKNITPSFHDAALRNKEKAILHATITGYGNTQLEPQVPDPSKEMAALLKLVDDGFPKARVVVRIDPIIPTDRGLTRAKKDLRQGPESRVSPVPGERHRYVPACPGTVPKGWAAPPLRP